MTEVNEALDLPRTASAEQLALRIRDLVMATNKV